MMPLWKHVGIYLVCVVSAAFAAAPAFAAENCVLTRVAHLPMSISEAGYPTVAISIDGHQMTMAIDTAIGVSTLSQTTVSRLGLESHRLRRIIRNGIYDVDFDSSVLVHNVKIGDLNSDAMAFAYDRRNLSADLDGILSTDVLGNYDVEFDFAGATFNLYLPNHCPHQFAQWTNGEYAVVDVKLGPAGVIFLPVQLDGKDVQAVLATGFAQSRLGFERAAYLFDLDQSDPDLTRLPESTERVQYYRYPFKTLTFQGVTVSHPDIQLVAHPRQDVVFHLRYLVLGLDILRKLHLYISYAEHKIYITSATTH